MRTAALLTVLTLIIPGTALAVTTVDRTITASAKGQIAMEIPLGSVRIVGWDRDEVHITGTLGDGVNGLEIDRDEEEIYIELSYMGHDERSSEANLEVKVPRGSELEIEGIRTDVNVFGVSGSVYVETVRGDIDLDVQSPEVQVESIAGEIKIRGGAKMVYAESASGTIDVSGVLHGAELEAVSGNVRLTDSRITEAELSTAAGNIYFQGTFAPDGRFQAESLNGKVELVLPSDVKADFEVETFNGSIEIGFEGVEVERSHGGPGRSAYFSTGGEGFRVQVETFNGSCVIRKE